jgi:hypothetical protein
MEAGTADRTKLAEKKKDGPSRAMLEDFPGPIKFANWVCL